MEISEVTRRGVIDDFAVTATPWWGCLQEHEFLARLYDLEAVPSTDRRFHSAARDIWQHRVNNSDWPDDWVFYDDRFKVLWAADEVFLRFLCESVHPVVRPDSDEARTLVESYNGQLRKDGWELVETKQISGRPVFAPRKVGTRIEIFDEPTGWPRVDRQMGEVRARLQEASTEEQFQAVGLVCREALITLAQLVHDPSRHPTIDRVPASETDAKRRLDAFVVAELPGRGNEAARKHAKAALDLANDLQHRRTAGFRQAALCAEATTSVVNIVAIISGRRSQ